MPIFQRLAFLLLCSIPLLGSAAALPPWEFGMSVNEVTSHTELGPYKSFRNGDVETFAYRINRQATNVQFYFAQAGDKGTGLHRISIGFYEGNDAKAAASAWQRAYQFIKDNFGQVEVPAIHIRQEGGPSDAIPAPDLAVLAIAAAAHAEATGKTQMAPVQQPKDKFVFSSFNAATFEGAKLYRVVVYFDRP